MRVAVISDTHLPQFGRSLPDPLVTAIGELRAELVLHLGDWTSEVGVEALEALGRPFDGVAGNNDRPELVARFGTEKVVSIGGARIGLTHGHLGPGRTTPERALATFRGERVDAVLFGHSHIPSLDWQPAAELSAGRRLLLNPGSPTDRRREPRCSWALLEVTEGRVEATLLYLERLPPRRGRSVDRDPAAAET